MNMDTTIKQVFPDVQVDKLSLSGKLSLFSDKCMALAEVSDEFICEPQIQSIRTWVMDARTNYESGYFGGQSRFLPENVNLLEEVVNDLEARVGLKWTEDVVDGRRGKFTRRFGQALKDAGLDKRLVEMYQSEIGNTLGQSFNGHQYHVIDVTQVFDWDDGDFGDSGSCFWDDMSWCRRTMEEHGAYAFRLYGSGRSYAPSGFEEDVHELITQCGVNVNDVYNRYARCWAAVDKPKGGMVTIFNTYGISESRMARVLANFLGLSYVKCYVSNTDLYINSCSYILANKKYVESNYHDTPTVNLNWYGENSDEDEYY